MREDSSGMETPVQRGLFKDWEVGLCDWDSGNRAGERGPQARGSRAWAPVLGVEMEASGSTGDVYQRVS